MATDGRKLVILDTDPGIDDAMALLYLSASPGVRLDSITTVFGNGDIDTTSRNAAYLVERFALGLRVYPGAAGPLAGERHIPALKVHGEDGLGGHGLADGFPPPPPTVPAWEHIARTILANPGKVSLLAIGPLTNLALALRHRPEIASLTREVVIMGGAFGTQGRRGNIRPHAEANFYYDPLAAKKVLAAGWPVTVVGLDVSTDCILSSAQAKALAATGGDAGALLWQISRGYAEIYRQFDGIDGFCIHDVAAAACLVSPHLFSLCGAALDVATGGDDAGRSFVADDDRRHQQHYCDGVAAGQLVTDFIAAIERLAAPQPSSAG